MVTVPACQIWQRLTVLPFKLIAGACNKGQKSHRCRLLGSHEGDAPKSSMFLVQVDLGDLLPCMQGALQGAAGAVLTPSLPDLAARLDQLPQAATSAAYYDSFVAGVPHADFCGTLMCLLSHGMYIQMQDRACASERHVLRLA